VHLSRAPRLWECDRFLGDNGFAIDGGAGLSVTEVGAERYETHGWQGLTVQSGNLT